MEAGTEIGGGGGSDGIVFRPFADAQRSPRSKKDKPDPALCAGMPLPIHLRPTFPKKLIGKPIDDVDPYYQNKNTFIVVGGHWIIYRFDADESLFVLSATNRVRQVAITVATHAFAHYFMFLVVCLYAILHMPTLNTFGRLGFYVIFVAEVAVKVVASGFLLKPFAYLRDPWNWLDFIATLLTIPAFFGVGYFAPIRIIRLVNFFTESRLLFATTYNVLLKMRDVLMYAVFVLIITSILFMNIYAGTLSSKCVKDRLQNDTSATDEQKFYVSDWYTNHEGYMVCGNTSGALGCPENYTCHANVGMNPSYGYTSFDNVFMSSLSVFRLMTRDWWDNLYDMVQATSGSNHLILFLIVVVFGSYMLKVFVAAHMFVNHGQMLDILMDRKKKKIEVKCSIEDTEKEKCREDGKDTALVDVPFADDVTTHFKKESSVPKEEPEIVILSKNINTEKDEVIKDSINPLENCCSLCLDFLCAWKCCGCCTKMQEFLSKIVLNRYFNIFICITIVVNTLAMALDHHQMSHSLAYFMYNVNYVVLLIYFFEAILKILALSPKGYFGDSWCRFEFLIVFLAFVELSLANVSGLSILQSLRLLRVVRIGKFYRHFNSLLTVGLARIFVVFVFVLYFSVLGEFSFGYNYTHHVEMFRVQELPRLNFTDFMQSMLIIMRILCGGWVETFWDCILVNGTGCIPFYFIVVILANLLILNIVISYVMIAFPSHNICEEEEEEEVEDEEDNWLFTRISDIFDRCCPKGSEPVPSAKSEEHLCEISLEGEVKPTDVNVHSVEVVDACCPAVCYSWFPFCGSPSTSPTAATTQTSFWSTWQNFRSRLLVIMKNDLFRTVFALFVFITCCISFAQAKVEGGLGTSVNLIVFIVFTLELVLKFCAIGCKTYFSTGWNWFDFVVTILHLCSCVFGSLLGHIGSYFYAMRILKLFSYNRRFPVVIDAIMFRFSYVTNAVFASSILWILFAIMGVQLLAGRFYGCEDLSGNRLDFHIVNAVNDCIGWNYTWMPAEINFDNVGNAFVALLQVATGHGDLMVIFSAIDSRGIDLQPSRETNVFISFYFVVFMYFCVLCCYAFVFTSFLKKINAQKRCEGGYLLTLMTSKQKKKYSDRKKTLFKRPLKMVPEPTMSIRKPFYHLVTSQKFNLAIFLVLVFAAVTLAIEDLDTSHRMATALGYIHIIFIIVFVIEILLKLIAFGRGFFGSSWNVYDLCVIAPLPIAIILMEFAAKYIMSHVMFLFLVILRLIRRIKCIRRVFVTLRIWLPVIYNVSHLLFVVVFFYAAAGVQLFQYYHFRAGLDELHNFNSVNDGLRVMIRLAFGGSWDGIYSGLMPTSEHCYENDGRCAGPFHVFLFVISFFAVCFLILHQTGSVLILEYYECLVRKNHLGITDEDLEDFNSVWRVFDPYGSGSIPYDHFSDLLATLAAPFKSEQPNDEKIAALDVPVSKENRVAYDDVLPSLLRHLDIDYTSTVQESDKCGTLNLTQQREEESARKIQKWWKNREETDNRVEDK